MTIARMRAEAEEAYGQKLSEIAPAVDKIQGGFSKDDGASVRKVPRSAQFLPRLDVANLALSRRRSTVYGPKW